MNARLRQFAALALLALFLTACAGSPNNAGAQASTTQSFTAAEGCDAFVDVTAEAMNLRLDGQPAHRAMAWFDDSSLNQQDQELWSTIVFRVYELPRPWLTGSKRADFLSQVYRNCLQRMQSF